MNARHRSAAVLGGVGGLVLGIWFGVALTKPAEPARTMTSTGTAGAPDTPAPTRAAPAGMTATAPAPVIAPAATPAAPAVPATPRADRAKPVRAATGSATSPAPRARSVSLTAPALHERLKPVLARGTKMDLAIEGFDTAEAFATMAHAARNTAVPFVLLKHRVLIEGQSLAAAIRASRPELNGDAEVARARRAARADLEGL